MGESSDVTPVWPPKQDVLGVPISRVRFGQLVSCFDDRLPTRAITVNVCNVHSVMSARSDRDLADALQAGDINTPDGMPLVWFMRSLGIESQERINGSEIALRTMKYGLSRRWRHFFYGSMPETLDLLTRNLMRRFPSLEVAGMMSPPFRPMSAKEHQETLAAVRATRPDIVWVGLGMPKQEKWMRDVRDELPGTVLVGIGAVFDFLAGTKPHAPTWMQDHGLEWLFRFASEPRRLWRRYIFNNPAFLALWLRAVAANRASALATRGRLG